MLKLLQSYYHFLSLGKFMEQVIMTNNLSELAINIPIPTGEKSSFLLKENLIKRLLETIYQHPQQRNIYGYLTEISAFKGIFSIMRELIENDDTFRDFLKETLQDQYFAFEQTIRFVRNVLNHTTNSDLSIKLEDFEIQKDFILSPKVQRVQKLKGSALIELNFTYSKYIKQRQGSKEYGIQLKIDFNNLKPGNILEDLISRHDLYLLSELCFNLSQITGIKKNQKLVSKKKTTKETKEPQKSTAKKAKNIKKEKKEEIKVKKSKKTIKNPNKKINNSKKNKKTIRKKD